MYKTKYTVTITAHNVGELTAIINTLTSVYSELGGQIIETMQIAVEEL